MKNILRILCLMILFSCSSNDLKKENEELVQLTNKLSTLTTELQQRVNAQKGLAELATAQARKAQEDADEQIRLAMKEVEDLREQLKNCN